MAPPVAILNSEAALKYLTREPDRESRVSWQSVEDRTGGEITVILALLRKAISHKRS